MDNRYAVPLIISGQTPFDKPSFAGRPPPRPASARKEFLMKKLFSLLLSAALLSGLLVTGASAATLQSNQAVYQLSQDPLGTEPFSYSATETHSATLVPVGTAIQSGGDGLLLVEVFLYHEAEKHWNLDSMLSGQSQLTIRDGDHIYHISTMDPSSSEPNAVLDRGIWVKGQSTGEVQPVTVTGEPVDDWAANLVNEAALRAVRKGRKLVTQEDLLAAFELVIAGAEKKGSVLSEFEKKLVAYHEVGHAMVAYKQKNAEPVQKITIVPHTQGSLGYTLLMPEEDKTELRTKDELMAKITVSMGGRAAEEVVMNTMTNGASQDIQEATSIARNMVAMFGMSDEFGMMALASRRSQYLDGGYGMDCAQDTAARMDQAVKDILDQCYQQAVEVIKASREDMDKVVAYLLEKETITGGEMVAIIQGRDPALVEEAYASTASRERRPLPGDIEPPARNIHIVSEEIKAPIPLEEPEDPAESEETPAEEDSADGGEAPEPSASASEEPVRNEDAVPTEEDPSDTKPKA